MFTRIRSLICITLVLICLIRKSYGSNNTEFPGMVKSVSVKVLEAERSADDRSVNKSLKLYISWMPPSGKRKPSSYSVIITGVLTKNLHEGECPENSIFYTSSDNSQLNVLLPENNVSVDMPEMHILPNCSYKVQVYANPRTKPTANPPEVIYTVPECVGQKCSCANVESSLPIPKVNAVQRDKSLLVNWNITSNDANVRFYVISICTPLLTSKNGLAVYNITKIGEVTAEKFLFLWNFEDDALQMNSKISVKAMDHHGCFGTEGTYIMTKSYSKSEEHDIWSILFGIIGACTLLGILVFAAFAWKKFFLSLTRSYPSIRKIPQCKSQWIYSVLQNRNVLYIQAEHEDEYGNDIDKLQGMYKNVILLDELGKGQFGKVYLGRLNDTRGTLVAVKVSQSMDTETRHQFIEEIEIMKAAGSHPRLVHLIGYCNQPDKPICIILEYMQGGDLLAYLYSRRKCTMDKKCITNYNKNTLSDECSTNNSQTSYTSISLALTSNTNDVQLMSNQKNSAFNYKAFKPTIESNQESKCNWFEKIGRQKFLKFALDIATGMEHLELKGITHRDLAARNILLGSDLTLKISDFGLSRNGVYVIKKNVGKARHLPIRWMSPEALRDRAFSIKSDVWSFGIVLWEIATLGSFPYSDIQDDRLLHHIIREGGRLEKPEGVSSDIYKTMCSCWATEAEDRPSFSQILLELQAQIVLLNSHTSASNPCYQLY